MAITYNKNTVKKSRQITTGSPRDHQLKQQNFQQDNLSVIEDLKNQIILLQDKLMLSNQSLSSHNIFTAEQVNEEISKAIKEETSKLKIELEEANKTVKKDKERIASLKLDLDHVTLKVKLFEKDIEFLNNQLAEKDKLINELKSGDNNVTTLLTDAVKKIEAFSLLQPMESTVGISSDRPKMETVFVDPTEKGATVDGKLSVVEENSSIKGKDVDNKVNKLKNLLGKLPDKG